MSFLRVDHIENADCDGAPVLTNGIVVDTSLSAPSVNIAGTCTAGTMIGVGRSLTSVPGLGVNTAISLLFVL